MRRPWRTTAWSSASRTRITRAPPAAPWCRRRASSRRCSVPPSSVARSSIDVSPSRWPRTSGPSGSKPQPSSETLSTSALAAVLELHRDALGAGVAERVAERLLRDPQHLGRRAGARAAARRARAGRSRWPDTRRSTSTCLRSTVASPSASSEPGRSSKTTARSSSIAPRASSDTRLSSPPRAVAVAREQRRRRLGRQRDAEQPLRDASRAARARAGCAPRRCQLAAALVQARVLDRDRGVRGEQLDQLLVVASENVEPSSFSVRYSAPITSPRATIGTPRNERICGCARGHQPRKRGSAADVVGPVRLGASPASRRASRACAGAGPSPRSARRSSRT